MTKIYLDTCSIQRPLDSRTQVRIILEAEAVLSILRWCEADQLTLVASDALSFETERNPNPTRREYALGILDKAEEWAVLDETVESRARAFNVLGIKPLDALHLASAEAVQADYFCTCDDRLRNQARQIEDLNVQVVSALDLIKEIEI